MAELWRNNLDVAAYLTGTLYITIAFLSLMITRVLRYQKFWVWLSAASLCIGFASWFEVSLFSSSMVVQPWISLVLKTAGYIVLFRYAWDVWSHSGGSCKYAQYYVVAASVIVLYSVNGGSIVATSVSTLLLFVPACIIIALSLLSYLQVPTVNRWLCVITAFCALLVAGCSIAVPLRSMASLLPVTERITLNAIAVSGLLNIIALTAVVLGITTYLTSVYRKRFPTIAPYYHFVVITVTVLFAYITSYIAIATTAKVVEQAKDSFNSSAMETVDQLEATKRSRPGAAMDQRYEIIREALINNTAIMRVRLAHLYAQSGSYDEITSSSVGTYDVGYLLPLKKVCLVSKLDDPKNAVLTLESPYLFVTRRGYLMRIPTIISSMILIGLWLLIGAIAASSKQIAADYQNASESIGMRQLRINKIFNCSQIGMAVLDLQANIQETNEATCRFLGRTSEELIGMSLGLLIMQDDYPAIPKEIDLLARTIKDVYTTEIRFARPDGHQVWALMNLMFEPDEFEGRHHIIMQLQDITSRKQDEEQLRHSWEMLQVLLNAPNYGVYLLKPNGTVLLCNEYAARRSGLTVEQMIGVRPLDELSAEHRDYRVEQFQRVLQQAEPVRYEDICADHSTSVSMWPVLDENGAVSTVALFMQDTTEARQNKLELAQMTQQAAELKSIVEHSNLMVMRASVTRNKAAITFVGGNLDLLGYSKEFYLSPSFQWRSIFAHEDYDAVNDEFWTKYQRGDREFHVETRMRDAHGSEQWYALAIKTTKDSLGNNTGFEMMINNVHNLRVAEYEARNMEQRMIQTQKFESLAVLAGGIAHDLNNSLMAIIGNTELLIDGIASNTQASLQEMLTAAQRAAKLSEQMLTFSGKGIFHLNPSRVNELVKDTVNGLSSKRPSNVSIQFHLDDDIPEIQADSSQISQVITNLCLNAFEAMTAEGGNISISTAEQILTGNEEFGPHASEVIAGQYISITISDDGPGIDNIIQERLFEPFVSTKMPGRGLGLAAVLGIIRAHGGYIKIDSEIAKGTSVTVYLPMKQASAPQVASVSMKSAKKTNRILLVDDETAILDVGTQMLKHLGYDVVTAHNGSEALVAFAELDGNVDCILLDLTMPIMDGGQTLRALRMVNQTVPVVFVSGYDYSSVFDKINGLKYQGFLQKPYRISQIQQILDRL